MMMMLLVLILLFHKSLKSGFVRGKVFVFVIVVYWIHHLYYYL